MDIAILNIITEEEVNDTFSDTTIVPIPTTLGPNTVECYNAQSFLLFQYTTDDLLLAASMAATVFNVMVIFCAVKLFKKSGDTMHLFILNMTLGDLLLTAFCHPNELLIRKHDFLQQIHLCEVVHFLNWTGLAVSGLSLTMLNVDKLIFFRWPLTYDRSMSKRRAALFCLSIWGVSVGFVTYCWAFNIVYIYKIDCSLQMSPGRTMYYELFLVLFCVLPVTSSLFVSIYLFNLTRQKRNATLTGVGESSAFNRKVKSLVFIFATTVWTSFSLLPYRIMNLCRIHMFTWSELTCEGKQIMNWVAWILVYLLTVNPIVNPLITSLIYAPYRLTIKKFLVNIPVGNRPIYSYQGEPLASDGSFVSVRRNRTLRSSSTELASLRQSTEVRMSLSEQPWTPMKSPSQANEQEFVFTPRTRGSDDTVTDMSHEERSEVTEGDSNTFDDTSSVEAPSQVSSEDEVHRKTTLVPPSPESATRSPASTAKSEISTIPYQKTHPTTSEPTDPTPPDDKSKDHT